MCLVKEDEWYFVPLSKGSPESSICSELQACVHVRLSKALKATFC